ncbi:MAG: hypothetical protein ACETVS_00055, partial [Dehalococcoidales bacterium]
EYAHLIKPLVAKKGPPGLYPEPRMWMEGKDMEGFNASFSFGFVKNTGVCHPLKGALVHPYDECLVFEGTDSSNILYLGAEVSIELGEEAEEHVFTEPSVVLIPKGMPHGPVTYRRVDRPIVHYHIGLAADYKATPVPQKAKAAKSTDSKYGHLIKRMITYIDWQKASMRRPEDPLDYSAIADRAGVLHPAERGVGPGNGDQIVWLFGENLEGFDVNFTWGFYSQCGKWHRGGEAHYHPEEEILVYVGLDPDNLDYLGAELELGMGKDYERHIFNTPTVAICPAAFPHLPLITRWVDKPYGFIVVCLSGEHASPWVEA